MPVFAAGNMLPSRKAVDYASAGQVARLRLLLRLFDVKEDWSDEFEGQAAAGTVVFNDWQDRIRRLENAAIKARQDRY